MNINKGQKSLNFPFPRNIILENYISIPHVIKDFKALKSVNQQYLLLNNNSLCWKIRIL